MRLFLIFVISLFCAIPQLTAQGNGIEQTSELVTVGSDKFLRWYGHDDRTYFIQVSDPNDHLNKWTWAPIIESGNDEDISYEVDGTADKGFFRLKYTDQPTTDPDYDDFDGDSISNLFEVSYYNTDPLDADSDNDGMLDGYEIYHYLDPTFDDSGSDFDGDGLSNIFEQNIGTFPNEPDSDGDGAPDGDEVRNGTDPNSAASYSAAWKGINSSLQYDFDDYPPAQGGPHGTLSISASWDASLNSTTPITSAIAWTTLSNRLDAEAPLPQTKPAQVSGGLADAYGSASLIPNPPCYHASLQHRRFWLESSFASLAEVKRTVLIVTERTINGQASAPIIQAFSKSIPAGSTISQPLDVLPAFTTNPSGNSYKTETVNMKVVPVELILDKTKLDLLDAQKWEVKITGTLPAGAVTNYKFEMRRMTETNWHQMQTGTSAVYTEKPRVAGKFKVAAVLTVSGQSVRTNEVDLEVQFPDAAKILGGAGVQARMNQAWQDTLAATTSTSRREEGYYITLNTDTEAYGISAHTIATPVGNNAGASWDTVTIPRPPDIPASPVPTDKPTYTVAWYHTHTPTTHRSVGRGVGPSPEDGLFGSHNSINIPGYAHDYIESPAGSGAIPAAHPLNSSAKIYNITPPDRRPTP